MSEGATVDGAVLELLSLSAGRMVATAESCTGGLIAGALTEVAGSSSLFDRGFVTYSNEAKQEMLGVTRQALTDFGAVSAQVAEQMARGALARSNSFASVAVTGIAGPGGGSADKPVGLVYIACANVGENADVQCQVERHQFRGERRRVREQTVLAALAQLKTALS